MTTSRILDIPMEDSTKRSQYAYRCIPYRKDIDSQAMLPVMQIHTCPGYYPCGFDAVEIYIARTYARRFFRREAV